MSWKASLMMIYIYMTYGNINICMCTYICSSKIVITMHLDMGYILYRTYIYSYSMYVVYIHIDVYVYLVEM